MAVLIALPFAALIIAIIAVNVLRNVHRISGSANGDWSSPADPAARKPADEFHDQTWLPLCVAVSEAAELRLGRPLSNRERRAIWRARSPLVLEIALQDIQATTTSDSVTALIAALPSGIDRPDPTDWSKQK